MATNEPADVYHCCTLDDGHDGPCVWECGECHGSGNCWECGGDSPYDTLRRCGSCDSEGKCRDCGGSGVEVEEVAISGRDG